ncbi:MAG: helix-turn-helix domain-containing protein [Oscillospiraceae bacterium]|nr:helix-turn-helix domain-containing protein [Oscillospiraceae bacterium]
MPTVALTSTQRQAQKEKATIERITKLIRIAMAVNGLNQRDLAEKVGLDPSSLGRRMRGESEFRGSELRTIADALHMDNTTRAALLGGEKCAYER